MQQVLIALRFYTTETFEQVIDGDLFGLSVFAACTVIHKVSRAITKRKERFLRIFCHSLRTWLIPRESFIRKYNELIMQLTIFGAFENYCTPSTS